MTIEAQIREVETTGTVQVPFQNPRADLFFKALREEYMLILNSCPIYVLDVDYKKTRDLLIFTIERVNPITALDGEGSTP